MIVTFHHPPAKDAAGRQSPNPFRDFNPNDPTHYPDGTGVYIYGLRLNIVNTNIGIKLYEKNEVPIDHENWKFVPLYTGIAHAPNTMGSLRRRLQIDHYNKERTDGNSEKEMFDFSLLQFDIANLISRYTAMGLYDSFLGNPGPGSKLSKIYNIEHLIWFRDLTFYLLNCGVSPLMPKLDSKQFDTIRPGGNFDNDIIPAFTTYINQNREKIRATKKRFYDHFYFVYAQFKDKDHQLIKEKPDISEMEHPALWELGGEKPDETFLNGIEHATKQALKGLGIYTTADSKQKTTETINIDLKEIIDKLVNVTGLPLPLNLSYTPPL